MGAQDVAEMEGFEPSVGFWTHTRLAIEHLRPLGHISTFKEHWPIWQAHFLRLIGEDFCENVRCDHTEEAVGFEPTSPLGLTAFKAVALNHSATPPDGPTVFISARRCGQDPYTVSMHLERQQNRRPADSSPGLPVMCGPLPDPIR